MEHHTVDDQSHYEISLTAGQAFVAFVLLLLSLAASFTFGLMLGKGQADERLVVQKDVPVVTEASLSPAKRDARIVELGVDDDDFREPQKVSTSSADTAPVIAELPAGEAAGELPSQGAAEIEARTTPAEPSPGTAATNEPLAAVKTAATPAVPHYAQLASTSDQKSAESLATKLIDAGFLSAYVERGQTEKGPVFRVRVRFPSEADARAAEAKLRSFSKEVWITSR